MKPKDELIHCYKKWDEAIVHNNAEEITMYMADDWILVATDGGITPGSVFLSSIKSGDLIHTRMDSDEMHVSIYGNTGVVVNRGTSSGSYKGKSFSFYEWSTSIFIRHEEKWSCVLTMLTPAKENRSQQLPG